jgi:ADP-ribose pyrophosphatase YjhB (NUDIX family)
LASQRALCSRDFRFKPFPQPAYAFAARQHRLGGRPDETLRRDLLEETGWRIRQIELLGFIHFHHLSPKPSGYPFPHPDFLQLIYTAEADSFVPQAMNAGDYETATGFRAIAAARSLDIDPGQRLLLDAAVGKRLSEGQT